jgi:hypothetical protein
MIPFLTLIALFSFAPQTHAEVLRLEHQGREVKINFVLHDGVMMDEKCQNDLIHCQAFQQYQRQQSTENKGWTTNANEAVQYCKEVQGESIHLLNETDDDLSFCSFTDHTLIDSWKLYEHRGNKP